MTDFKNILLIAGEGRNVGKTHLGCQITKGLTNKGISVVTVKISGHFHKISSNHITLLNEQGLFIGRELDIKQDKDSSRYLNSGAYQSYYVQSHQDKLPVLVEFLQNEFHNHQPIIIESAALGELIEPGMAFFVMQKNSGKQCTWNFRHHKLKGFDGDYLPEWPLIDWINKGWVLRDLTLHKSSVIQTITNES